MTPLPSDSPSPPKISLFFSPLLKVPFIKGVILRSLSSFSLLHSLNLSSSLWQRSSFSPMSRAFKFPFDGPSLWAVNYGLPSCILITEACSPKVRFNVGEGDVCLHLVFIFPQILINTEALVLPQETWVNMLLQGTWCFPDYFGSQLASAKIFANI